MPEGMHAILFPMHKAPRPTFHDVYARKWTFLGVFTFVFFVSFSTLSLMGASPAAFRASFLNTPPSVTPGGITPEPGEKGEMPIGIEIPSIGVKANVANPRSNDLATLDNALLAGAVRYPGTGIPGEKGNVLIFGHSSHLPVVHNQSFKAFNDIQNLKNDEPIYVVGPTKVFVYAVEKVERANTASDAISLDVNGAKLTLATCDNFGSKEDRWIVTAHLVAVEERERAE